MRTVWSIVIIAVLLLSYAGNATAGSLIAAGLMTDHCSSHLASQDDHSSKGCNHAQDAQKQDAGHCHCPCHIAPLADVVRPTLQLSPGSCILFVAKVADEAAEEGPVIGIDHPPQLV